MKGANKGGLITPAPTQLGQRCPLRLGDGLDGEVAQGISVDEELDPVRLIITGVPRAKD